MQALDEAVGLVEITAQLGVFAAVMHGTAYRGPQPPHLRGFEPLRDVSDLLEQRFQQYPGLRRPRVLHHPWIVSPLSHLRAPIRE
jgi:hypothetical protein